QLCLYQQFPLDAEKLAGKIGALRSYGTLHSGEAYIRALEEFQTARAVILHGMQTIRADDLSNELRSQPLNALSKVEQILALIEAGGSLLLAMQHVFGLHWIQRITEGTARRQISEALETNHISSYALSCVEDVIRLARWLLRFDERDWRPKNPNRIEM